MSVQVKNYTPHIWGVRAIAIGGSVTVSLYRIGSTAKSTGGWSASTRSDKRLARLLVRGQKKADRKNRAEARAAALLARAIPQTAQI